MLTWKPPSVEEPHVGALPAPNGVSKPREASDWQTIQELLQKHYEYTGSPIAKELLDNPAAAQKRFTRIQPTGWAAIRNELKQARAAGNAMTEDDWNQPLWNEMLEHAHGNNAPTSLKVANENKRSAELAEAELAEIPSVEPVETTGGHR